MRTKLVVIGFVALVFSGIFFTVKFGLQPRAVSLIRLSTFETPKKLAESVLLRLHQEIRQMPLLLIGYQPEKPEQLQVIKEFLNSNRETDLSYDTVVVDENLNLRDELSANEKIDSRARIESLAAGLKKALEDKKRVALIVPAIYSAQLIRGNVADQLKKNFQLPIGSLTIAELPRSREEEKSVGIPCQVPDADSSGVGALGCAILQAGRANYRKHLQPGLRTAIVDQRGVADYFIFYSNEYEMRKIE